MDTIGINLLIIKHLSNKRRVMEGAKTYYRHRLINRHRGSLFCRKDRPTPYCTIIHDEPDIYIDWLGSSLDEGPSGEQRLNTVIVGDDLEIKVISIEDLIIDRLSAAKFWRDEDSFMWAKVLIRVKEATGEPMDIEYLRERASKEEVQELLEELLKITNH